MIEISLLFQSGLKKILGNLSTKKIQNEVLTGFVVMLRNYFQKLHEYTLFQHYIQDTAGGSYRK